MDGRREVDRERTDRECRIGSRLEGGKAGRRAEKIRVCWEGMCRCTGQAVEGGGGGHMPICFGIYNIRNRQSGGLELAVRGMVQSNVDVGVFQKTKLADSIYIQGLAGYKVIAKPAPIRQRGGVTLFYQEYPAFAVEAIYQFGVNVIACQMVKGERRWYIVGCYLALGDGATIQEVEAEVAEPPRGTDLIVAGDSKVDLERTSRCGRDEDIAATAATEGIEDISAHFLLQHRARNRYQNAGGGEAGEGSEVLDRLHPGI